MGAFQNLFSKPFLKTFAKLIGFYYKSKNLPAKTTKEHFVKVLYRIEK